MKDETGTLGNFDQAVYEASMFDYRKQSVDFSEFRKVHAHICMLVYLEIS